jgi:putative peptide zinc metalloprotease protein
VQWIRHPDGYWILRNPEDVTFLQVSDRDKSVISQFGQQPLATIASSSNITRDELRYLLQLLTATAMLSGTKPSKHIRRKFNPLQLLSFKIRLFNPDAWLTQHVNKLRWIWTTSFCSILCFFLAWSILIGLNQSAEIFATGQQLWTTRGGHVLLPFALLMMLVVSLHELGHAFTLKHYGGIVPEIGLLFMCFMPGCYTNTTDSYCLVKRQQRTFVVAAGVLIQLIIWAIALWFWNLSNPNTWLHTVSYLLMVAALFTVALNLNPLSKFDGYYLAVALSGINNLRSRSFQFYGNLLRFQPSSECLRDALILAAYAPFSFAYILLVFGHLWLGLGDWVLTHIPVTALFLFGLWAIYFYSPRKN